VLFAYNFDEASAASSKLQMSMAGAFRERASLHRLVEMNPNSYYDKTEHCSSLHFVEKRLVSVIYLLPLLIDQPIICRYACGYYHYKSKVWHV